MERLRSRLRNTTLDVSPSSLRVLDAHLTGVAAEEEHPIPRELVLEVTAYFGEVVRRALNGTWGIDSRDDKMPTVRLPNSDAEYPLVRAIKLVQDGDRLADWFEFIQRGGQRLLD
ncbi:MAG TPA: hypothetical protein VFS44_15490 [Gemmatimonadaceae bacterium]|nr:hypothetical protein [Gemmatimonadaceae bacterium]